MPPKTRARGTVVHLDDYRAKYISPPEPKDPFLRAAACDWRILIAAVKVDAVRTADLRILWGRMISSLDLCAADDPLAVKLRRQVPELEAQIDARERDGS